MTRHFNFLGGSALVRTIAVLLLVALSASGAGAASLYDPALTWQTVVSPNFAVHYHEGGRNLAVRVSRIAEEVLGDVSGLFGFRPDGRVEIVLSDAYDSANGSAQVLPKNIIRMRLAAPMETTGLSAYDDWLRILMIHELAHICDLDQTWGFTRFLRWIFGKYIGMNGFVPQFLSEGAGVYAETLLTRTGRGRSSYVNMLLRTAALEDRFLDIDQAHLSFSDWPGGNAPYFYGGMFHLWLAEKFGRDAVADLHQNNASMPLPYLYWPPAKLAFGESLTDLWDEWREELTQKSKRLAQEIEAQGVTPSQRLTTHGRNITGARYSNDGKFIIYSRSSPVDGRSVRRVERDGMGDRHLVLQAYSPRFSFTPDGEGFIFSQNAINERFNDYNDLYRYDIDGAKSIKLKNVDAPGDSLRARDPDISRDGKSVVFVQNELYQNRVTVGTFVDEKHSKMKLRVLIPPHGDVQHASPRFSPDGTRVAVSTWFSGGRRDIIIVDATSGDLIRRITFDRALDANPTWSPDGRYVLYDSDRDGVFNIYAYDLQEERHYRITRVVGGAFQPDVSDDGKSMLFRNASGIGFDIHEMPFELGARQAESYEPDAGYEAVVPGPMFGGGIARRDETPLSLIENEEEVPYSVWRTLLPFQDNWVLLPALYVLGDDPSFRLLTVGADVLGKHGYSLSVGSSWYTQQPNWSVGYVNDVGYPTFSLGARGQAYSYPVTGARLGERRTSAAVSMSLPLKQRHNIYTLYSYEHRSLLDASSETLHASGDYDWLTTGGFARLEFGYSYRFTRNFAYSVSPEHGRSLAVAGRWYSEYLGAQFNELLLTVDARSYLNNPWADNQVLALRLAGALALGPDYDETFKLGGVGGSSLFTTQAPQVYSLRGFPLDLDAYPPGSGLLVAYAEYRLPLWHVERGLWTLPVYVERFHMGLFAEGGNTFGKPPEEGDDTNLEAMSSKAWRRLKGSRMGVGAEVRVDLLLGWAFPLTVRGGVAWPLVQKGLWRWDVFEVQPVWFWALGSSV